MMEGYVFEEKGMELYVIARLKTGVTLEQARAEMSGIAHKLETDYPATNTGRDIKLTALRESRVQERKGKCVGNKNSPSGESSN